MVDEQKIKEQIVQIATRCYDSGLLVAGDGNISVRLDDGRLLTTYEVEGKEGEPAHHRVEIVHESLLTAWPRLVRWRAQDEEGALLRDQLKQAAHLWDEKGRTSDLLWTGTAFREFELWRERYPGGLSELEESFGRAMVARAGQRDDAVGVHVVDVAVRHERVQRRVRSLHAARVADHAARRVREGER